MELEKRDIKLEGTVDSKMWDKTDLSRIDEKYVLGEMDDNTASIVIMIPLHIVVQDGIAITENGRLEEGFVDDNEYVGYKHVYKLVLDMEHELIYDNLVTYPMLERNLHFYQEILDEVKQDYILFENTYHGDRIHIEYALHEDVVSLGHSGKIGNTNQMIHISITNTVTGGRYCTVVDPEDLLEGTDEIRDEKKLHVTESITWEVSEEGADSIADDIKKVCDMVLENNK